MYSCTTDSQSIFLQITYAYSQYGYAPRFKNNKALRKAVRRITQTASLHITSNEYRAAINAEMTLAQYTFIALYRVAQKKMQPQTSNFHLSEAYTVDICGY